MGSVRTTQRVTSSRLLASSAVIGLLATASVRAEDKGLGLYAGAGVGYATINQTFENPMGGPTQFPSDRVGWKLLVGIRPLDWLGSELEFIDFGTAHVGPATGPGPANGLPVPNQLYGADGSARAGALFALGYLPLHKTWIDIFGKVGFAYLRTSDSYSGNFPNTYINCDTTCMPVGQVSVTESDHSTGLAYGGGVQFHFGQLSLRLEYEAIKSDLAGNPDLASVGLTWKF